jgi:APA family basic amino acid/polyamine antiporter
MIRARIRAKVKPEASAPELVRGLGVFDVTLVTVGSILGTGIFITTGDIAKALPHGGLILLLWLLGGLVTLAGALTYAELGGMFPHAGGQYHFLKEAYSPFWGFLYGWGAFLVIMTGGIATMAVGFGEYLGAFLPFFSTKNVLVELPRVTLPLAGAYTLAINGGQVAGALAIAFLTAINYIGLKEGAGVQNAVTVVKIASIVGVGLVGLLVPATAVPQLMAPLPEGGGVLAAMGVGMIAVLWSFDGWYGATNLAGEMRRPGRDLPLGLILGTAIVTVLYTLLNVVYVRALSVEEMAATSRIGESAAVALFGPTGGRLINVAVLISTFGCISSTILYAARIYLPMAQDGVFLPALARIHPRYKTPAACILAQGIWAVVLTFSGSYEALYTYVVFAVVFFHVLTGAAVIVLRRTRPTAERPYRTWGYPVVPIVFVVASAALVLNTLVAKPVESLFGLVILALGIPAYVRWRRRARLASEARS